MHHLSNLSVAPLLCVHPVLSLCGKWLWKHVHVRFDLCGEETQTNPRRRCLVECLQGLGGDPCLPASHLSASPALAPFKHLL